MSDNWLKRHIKSDSAYLNMCLGIVKLDKSISSNTNLEISKDLLKLLSESSFKMSI